MVAVLAALGLWLLDARPGPATLPPAEPAPLPAPPPKPPQAATAAHASAVVLSAQDREFISALRSKFASAIHDKHTQIRVLDQIIAYLMEHYPDDWQGRVRAFLAQLFPELAEQLYTEFEKLLGFTEWLKTHRAELSQMTAPERRRALWEARRAAFGEAAEEIWRAEIRNEKVSDSLAALEQAQGKTTDEKLAQFLAAVGEAYGEQAPLFIERSQTELLNRFLSVSSIQADLNALPRSQQHASLQRVRSAMGLGGEALQRWDRLDAVRDQAWDAGQSYQLQRAAVVAQLSGEEQTRRLTALQDQMFGAEAETIRSEEAAGFFRYAHPRRIGRE